MTFVVWTVAEAAPRLRTMSHEIECAKPGAASTSHSARPSPLFQRLRGWRSSRNAEHHAVAEYRAAWRAVWRLQRERDSHRPFERVTDDEQPTRN